MTSHPVNGSLQERPGSLDNVDTLKEGTRLYDCPKEIFRLVDHIWQYGRHQVCYDSSNKL
ncbi:hypothetical protein DPMN_045739 [Dreissena polymorpha]|uniref:Uncharacterized protein n=1 Tax=Dreissena polymorpha TaxID=45954 RepID=A0A9D4D6L6_DREPO|nr:hypothetical protein DPMN_045739 [Dreissena polymorpha]